MKRLVKYLLVCSVFFTFTAGCADLFREEIYDIHEELDKINARLDELCEEMNTNISALQTIIEALQQKDYVEKVVPIKEGDVEVGYTIHFTQSGPVTIYHGEKGDDGHSPIVGMKQAEDGRWYWTIDDEWMRDTEGNLVLTFAEDGKDGITPKFEVREGDWYISYDNGETWTYYAQATGDKGDKGDSMFESVTYNEQYVTLVLADGVTTIQIPTWASHMLLVDELARVNNNIVALQQAVEALEKNDYVTKVTPIEENGEVLGYILSFAYTGDVSIYHGKDGHNPQVGVKQHTDGNWYWTVDDQWVLDENGEMIRTTGDNGLTPEFKIEDGQWYIRYGADQEWTEYGQATGDKGDQGDQGEQGDAIFAKDGIDVSNPNYIELTLVNGTKIQIPTLAAFQALEVFVGQINDNVTALQTIVAALQNNDYVTSVSDIIDPQTNEKIGFTIHFSKSGNVNVYHGEDGKDGVTPTVTISEDGYWVINGEKQTVKALGVNGVTPQFKIENGMWYISYDNTQSWSEAGQATGNQGDQGTQGPQGPVGPQGPTGNAGDAFFKSVTEEYAKDEDGNEITDILGKKIVAYIIITLADDDDDDTNNPVYRIPTDYVISDLQQQIDAITNDIKTIEIVVNAVQNAEYIKSVTPVYDGMVEIGYEIVFAKYTVEGGETTRKTTIYHGTAGTNGTVIGAAYDEASGTWYWTIDGQPLTDSDNQLVPLKGQNGVDGVTPQMNINTTTNFWEVSYDGGNTWVSTNVKATGDKGDNGEAGSNADAYIQNVVLEGNYYVFYVKDGSTFKVPTAQAFEALAVKVAALEESVNSISSVLGVLKGMKFIKSTERFENEAGSGYKLVLVTFDSQTMTATEETCYVYDGQNGTNGNDGHTPVVGLRQDANGDFYWTIDGNDLLVNGNPVKANGDKGSDGQAGANGPVPTFRIDEAGHLWVKVGDADEQDLGKVVGAAGSAGEAGTNASIEVTEKENGEIVITFKNGEQSTGSISVPSWAVFVTLQEQVSVLNTNVDALQKTVEALEKNVYVTKVEDHYVDGVPAGYKITFSDGKEAVILHGAKGDQGDKGQDATVPTFEVNADGYWVINGETTTYKAVGDKGEQGITPEFKIDSYTDADGKFYSSYWYVKYGQNAGWQPRGNAEGAPGDAFIYGIYPVGQDGVTTEGVTFTNAYYVKIVLKDNTPDTLEDNVTYVIPTKKVTDDLYALVNTLNENVAALQTAVNALSNRQYIKSYTPVEGGYELTVSNGIEDEIIYINHGTNGTNGTNGVTPTVTVKADEDGVLYWWVNEAWLLDAQGNKVPATGPKGEQGNVGSTGQNGVTPIFMIGNAEHEGSTLANCWLVSYDNGQSWTAVLGTDGKPFVAKGEAGSSGAAGDSFFADVNFETEKNANGIDVVTYLVLTLNDNTVHKIPTQYTIQLLADRITALENQMMTLQTLVNAISTQEYVKKIIGKYEGLVLTGYSITFVKFSLDNDGQLVEEEVIREVSIKGEADIPVIGVEKDEQTNVWYWTINGERIQVQGPQGEPGASAPVPSIGSNGNWYIGDQDTGVSAQGPQGETGPTGPQGDSFFKEVYYEDKDGNKVSASKDAYYLVFEMANEDVIKVPTASAFQSLIEEVAILKGSVEGLQALVENQKTALESLQGDYNDFITGLSEKRFAGTPTYNEATQTWVFPIVDGTGAQISGENNSFTIVQGNVVTVAAKEGSDRLYWVIDGEITDYPVTGNDGANGLTPNFRVNVEDGTLEYTFDDPNSATANWVSLGSVKGPQGPQGNPGQPGTAASTNVVFTNNPYPADGGIVFIESTNKEAVQAALWVGVQYGNSTEDIIWMPTYANFVALSSLLETLSSNVAALQAAVAALENNDYVTSITDVEEDGVVIGYTLNFAKSGPKTIYHGQKGETGANGLDAVAPRVQINSETKEWEISTDGGETYISTGVVAVGPQGETGAQGATPLFKIENGSWLVSYDNWQTSENLGQATGDAGDSFFQSVKPMDANGTDVASADAEYIKIDLTNGESYLIPTQKTIVAINTTISNLQTSVNAQIEAINAVVNALPNNKYITEIVPVDASKNVIAEGSNETVAGYMIVFYGSDPIYIMHGVDGATGPQGPQGEQGIQGTAPDVTIGDNGNWFINNVDTGKTAQGPQGETGVTPQLKVEGNEWTVSYDNGSTWTGLSIYAVPEFKIEDGKWMVSYDGGTSWTEKGQATGNTGATGDSFFQSVKPVDANGTDVASADAEYIKIDLTNGESYLIPTQKTILALEARVSSIEGTLGALVALLNETNTYISGITPDADGTGFTATIVSYTLNLDAGGNLVKDQSGNYYTITKTEQVRYDDSAVSVVKKDDGKWYWVVDGNETVLMDSGFIPQVHTAGGFVYISTDPQAVTSDLTTGWVKINPNDSDTDTDTFATYEAVEGGYKIIFADGTSIIIPSKDAFDDLVDTVAALDGKVTEIQQTINTHAATLQSLSALSGDVMNLMSDVAKLKTLKFIGTPQQTATGWIIPVTDGTGATLPDETITITNGEDGTVVTIVDGEDGEKYWAINGAITDYRVTGNDAREPNFRINPETGKLEYQFEGDAESEWVTLDKVVGEDGKDGAVNVVFTNTPDSYNPETETATAADALWVGVQYGENADAIIWMPTYKNFVELSNTVAGIRLNITTIDNMLSGKTFVSNVEPVYDASNTNIIGFKFTYRTVTGSVANNDASFSAEQTTTYTSSNYVVPVQENGVWYWYVNGTKICEINHTFVPKIEVYEGYIYVSVDSKATNVASDIQNATTAAYWVKLEHKDDNTQIPDTDTYGSYTEVMEGDVVVGYAITFPGTADPINVGKYFATPKVSITNAENETITELNIGSETNGSVNFSVVGSFAKDDAPEIIVTCEGGWTSSMERTDADNSVTGTITVTPTAVFNSGVVSGKLTVYVTYYGQTSVKQISLKANANVQFNKTAVATSAAQSIEIPFSSSMIADDAVPSLGFVYEYKDTDENSSIIEAPNVVSNNSAIHGQWIKNNGSVNGNISLSIDANITSKKRAGVVVAYTPDKKTELARFRVIQDAGSYGIINLADPANDGNYDPANCYVIQKAGKYMIPTFKGNNATNEGKFSIEGATVNVYNQYDNALSNLFANQVTRVTKLDDDTPVPDKMLVFDIKNVAGVSDILNNGNAVVQVEKEGEILWSWHLWFNPQYEIFGNTYGDQGFQTHPSTGKVMLDRNLGASSTTAAGLYYTWGNKNPYFDGIEAGSSTHTSKYYGGGSATEAWGDSKTIMDPCPPGYKVPNSNVWVATTSGSYNNSGFIYSSNPEIVYPFSGHVVNNTIDDDSKTLPKEITDNSTVVNYEGVDVTDWDAIKNLIKMTSWNKAEISIPTKRFKNIMYNIDMQQERGALWGSFYQEAFQYYKQDISFSIDIVNQVEVLECEYDEGTRKYEITTVPFSYKLVSEKWNDNWNHINRQDLGIMWTAEKAEITSQIKDELNGNPNMVFANSKIDTYDTQGCGLPVRCQKITPNN